MGQNKKATHKRLSELWKDNEVQELPLKNRKYIVFSDMHLGNQGKADDFRSNHDAMSRALDYYDQNGYYLILLGDIEEFWQFDLKDVMESYGSTIYKAMQEFAPKRIIRIFGNHDSEWGAIFDPATQETYKASPEAVKLVDATQKARVLLVHGHQGSTESDKNSWFSRFFVRLYRIVEPVIKIDKHPAATKSQIAKDYERIFHNWAEKNKVVVICGHSHRAIFASMSYADRLMQKVRELQKEIQNHQGSKSELKKKLKKLEKLWDRVREEEAKGRRISPAGAPVSAKGWYYNCGCALYTDGITGLEIENGEIRLVKWNRKTRAGKDRVILQPEDGGTHRLIDSVS